MKIRWGLTRTVVEPLGETGGVVGVPVTLTYYGVSLGRNRFFGLALAKYAGMGSLVVLS